ncbi:MAG: UDP-N-acetylmuramoyl-L-alanine--D-glutamate ligase [Lachnospiraceae bacterium]|jgi:UDP-N-acetylmuramoylalanine--D-glutamate ligase|nr:UDP-N-acetylmuramoyl-L-alanine--D-glutamate ligase [Lachnospiraceae bacterium]
MAGKQKMLVAGAGLSGTAALKLIEDLDGEALLYDMNADLDPAAALKKLEHPEKVKVVLGELKEGDLEDVSICVISPGIPLNSPFIRLLARQKITVWSEIELAYHCMRGKLVAITGTNGKTTTTALTGAILRAIYPEVFVVGNIGEPFCAKVLETTGNSYTVAEVSSFQLETTMDFRPDISAILNITPDHLDRHGTFENYAAIKKFIADRQRRDDFIVLNYDDPVLREWGEGSDLKPRTIFFSSTKELERGYYLDGELIIQADESGKSQVINVREMNLLGRHNYENAMAAIAICAKLGVSMDIIHNVLKTFRGVEHRIEFVLERAGVKYFNDSKGTNPEASIHAINAMPGPVLLIAGGYDKKSDYDKWVESFEGKVKYLVLIGATRDDIARCANAHGFYEIMYAEDMSEAVRVCASYADVGDCVLLSPACASWGMFKNFEERGKVFKECVRAL